MHVIIEANDFSDLLKKMKPKTKRFKSMVGSNVQITADSKTIILIGDFENSIEASAEVIEPGRGNFPLDSVIKILSTYKKSVKINIRCEPGVFWLDRFKISSCK
jgi:hypothetical protein